MDKPWACPPAALTVHPSAGSAKSLISVNRACCSSVCQRAVVFDFSVSSWMRRRETKVLMSRPSGAARLSGAVWLALQLPLLLLSESTGNPSLICRVSEVSARLLSRQPQTGTPFLSKDKMIKKNLLAQRFCCLFALSCKLSDENMNLLKHSPYISIGAKSLSPSQHTAVFQLSNVKLQKQIALKNVS